MIAVLLVGRNHAVQMQRCLESLIQSDIGNFELFYWDNASSEDNKGVLLDLSLRYGLDSFIYGQDCNLGIVIPRLRLLHLIRERRHSMVLDIHTDMLFPKTWFKSLVYETGFWEEELAAVAYPSILQSQNPPSPELLEAWVSRYSQGPKVIWDPIQTQPLVFKIHHLDKIGGYLDPVFHPMFCDDDDFRCRVWKAGYVAFGSGLSWVWHRGGLQSWGTDSLPAQEQDKLLSRNFGLFEAKHGMSVESFKQYILGGLHPAIQV